MRQISTGTITAAIFGLLPAVNIQRHAGRHREIIL